MRDLSRETRRGKLKNPGSSQGPELRKDVEVDECSILNLTVETTDESELRLGTSICLRFIVDFLRDFISKDLGRFSVLENAILTEREEGFEEVLADGETEDDILPWEERPVQKAGQTLFWLVHRFPRI